MIELPKYKMMMESAKKRRDGDSNEIICSKFGCTKKLSLIEKLAGDTCTKHMNKERKPFA